MVTTFFTGENMTQTDKWKKTKKWQRLDTTTDLPDSNNPDKYVPAKSWGNISTSFDEEKTEKKKPRTVKGADFKKRGAIHKDGLYEIPVVTKSQLKGVIVPRTTKRTDILGNEIVEAGKSAKGERVQYGGFERKRRYKNSQVMQRNIQWYRYWFLFLKLALEMEGDVLLGEKIKINRRFYKKWDLDEISSLKHYQFDNWWKSHRQLFQATPISLVKDIDDKDCLYVKIPIHRLETDVTREFRELIRGKLKGDKHDYPFTANDTTSFLKIHQQYNVLILTRNGASQKQIMEWLNDAYGHLMTRMIEEREGDKVIRLKAPVISTIPSLSRLLRSARNKVLNVAEGKFP